MAKNLPTCQTRHPLESITHLACPSSLKLPNGEKAQDLIGPWLHERGTQRSRPLLFHSVPGNSPSSHLWGQGLQAPPQELLRTKVPDFEGLSPLPPPKYLWKFQGQVEEGSREIP